MRSIGQNPTEDEILGLVIEYDVNGDGTIDFDEFIEMMTKVSSYFWAIKCFKLKQYVKRISNLIWFEKRKIAYTIFFYSIVLNCTIKKFQIEIVSNK